MPGQVDKLHLCPTGGARHNTRLRAQIASIFLNCDHGKTPIGHLTTPQGTWECVQSIFKGIICHTVNFSDGAVMSNFLINDRAQVAASFCTPRYLTEDATLYIIRSDTCTNCTCFGGTYTKIGTIQRRLAWPLRKDDTQIREAFHIFHHPRCWSTCFRSLDHWN